MIKNLISLFLLAIISSFANAEEEQQLPPLDPAYEGIHGMALMQKGSTVFAYHMPTYAKPHNVQLLYKLAVKDVNLLQVVRDNPLVTFKPDSFNLQQLMRGEKLAINGDVFIGHFERDGLPVYEQVTLNFDKQLYLRELNEVEVSGRIQEYSAVIYNKKNDRLYVHHIQKMPSYDHVLHIDLDASCPTKIATSSAVPTQDEIHRRFINCGTLRPMYYETSDFSK